MAFAVRGGDAGLPIDHEHFEPLPACELSYFACVRIGRGRHAETPPDDFILCARLFAVLVSMVHCNGARDSHWPKSARTIGCCADRYGAYGGRKRNQNSVGQAYSCAGRDSMVRSRVFAPRCHLCGGGRRCHVIRRAGSEDFANE